jgi:hypothetical protein
MRTFVVSTLVAALTLSPLSAVAAPAKIETPKPPVRMPDIGGTIKGYRLAGVYKGDALGKP